MDDHPSSGETNFSTPSSAAPSSALPGSMPPNGPAPHPGTPAPPVHNTVPRFDANTSFRGADTMERMKKYLHDIPVLHARLLSTIARLEKEAKELESLRGRIEETVRTAEAKGAGEAHGG